ncbi:hypothetical protein BD413DRAFT_615688 [Trametes elegans]|nr:hypothetical protein BD413DRAFT_615688 [Trametes elegans]
MTRLSPLAFDTKNLERPTLPSFASLNLPDVRHKPSMDPPALRPLKTDENNANESNALSPIPLEFNKYWDRPRQTSGSSVSSEASTSSSGTSSSRDSIDAGALSRRAVSAYSLKNLLRNHPYHHKQFHPDRHRLVLLDRFEDADAVLVVPPWFAGRNDDPKSVFAVAKSHGIKLNRVRIAQGHGIRMYADPEVRRRIPGRMYPYRIVPRDPSDPNSAPAPPAAPQQPSTTAAQDVKMVDAQSQ